MNRRVEARQGLYIPGERQRTQLKKINAQAREVAKLLRQKRVKAPLDVGETTVSHGAIRGRTVRHTSKLVGFPVVRKATRGPVVANDRHFRSRDITDERRSMDIVIDPETGDLAVVEHRKDPGHLSGQNGFSTPLSRTGRMLEHYRGDATSTPHPLSAVDLKDFPPDVIAQGLSELSADHAQQG